MLEYLTLGLKVLLFPAYHSTDFDVHRNWLAITNKLPLKQWYYEDTNISTLDYPPFFAYFEWALSQFTPKSVVEDGCLDLVAKSTYGWPTVVFQRATVVLTEFVLLLSLWHLEKSNYSLTNQQKRAVKYLIWLSPGWIILDHIHFQYNAMMYGVLIFSINAAVNGRPLLSATLFSTLLCFKHIYLYLAPAYFGYLLSAYVLENRRFNLLNTVKLGACTLLPFILCFLPFYDQMHQVLSRLFPFSRGLTHAYWAPNVWALYSFVDRILAFIRGNSSVSLTRGIVGQVNFSNLIDITPKATFLITLFYQILSIIPVMWNPTHTNFLKSLTLCGFASFLFGWHVHEKAILCVVIPFTLFALQSRKLTYAYLVLMATAYASLQPLIFTPQERFFKFAYTGLYVFIAMWVLPEICTIHPREGSNYYRFNLMRFSFMYISGFSLVFPALAVLALVFPRYEFMELMLLSVYCTLGVLGSWVALCSDYFMTVMVGPSSLGPKSKSQVSGPTKKLPKKQTKMNNT